MRPSLRSLLFVAVLAIAACLSPAAASGSSIAAGTYVADAGEINDVTVTYSSGTDTHTFTDAGVATITDGDGAICSTAGNVATCQGLGGLVLSLGDQDDEATVSSSAAIGFATLGGSTGDDTLNTSGVTTAPLTALYGEAGDDTITDGPAEESLIVGEAGDDEVNGGGGSDSVYGGVASDIDDNPALGMNTGDDDLSGGPGDDYIVGADGNDTLDGGDGFDQVYGYWGDDVLRGGDGPDIVDGSFGFAAEGSDALDGGGDDDVIWGRENGANAVDTIACGTGRDAPTVGPGDITSIDCDAVGRQVSCPETVNADCEGSIVITAKSGAGASSASAATTAGKKKKLKLGKKDFKNLAPGDTKSYRIELKKRKVRKALKGRSLAPAKSLTKSHAKRKKLPKEKLKFKLKKA